MNAAAEDMKRAQAAGAAEPTDDGSIILVQGSTLKPEPIRWLWDGWLARGKLHILAGAPGQGKTTLALACAATVTCGGRWPDGSRCEPGNVLVWSGEDDPQDTLLPRLHAMGADVSRVFFIKARRDGDDVLPFDPARDLVELAAAAKRIGHVKLLVLDPVVSAVTGDSHKNAEVRRGLQAVVDLAAVLDAAAIGITHFSKQSAGRDPSDRVVGSVAFTAVARVVMVAAKAQDAIDCERRVLARAKSNIGPDDGGFEYALDQIELDGYPGVMASRVTWGKSVKGSARDLLREAEDVGDAEDDDGPGDAAAWLRDLLGKGPVESREVKRYSDEAGYAWRTVQRSMKRAGAQSRRDGYPAKTVWFLAASSRATDASRATVAPVAPTFETGATGATDGATYGFGSERDDFEVL
jgi:RecA-family ATPase